jgi:hypothetical protein
MKKILLILLVIGSFSSFSSEEIDMTCATIKKDVYGHDFYSIDLLYHSGNKRIIESTLGFSWEAGLDFSTNGSITHKKNKLIFRVKSSDDSVWTLSRSIQKLVINKKTLKGFISLKQIPIIRSRYKVECEINKYENQMIGEMK